MSFFLPRTGFFSLVIGGLLTLASVPAAADEAPGDIRYQRGDSEMVDEAAAAFPPSVFPHWVHRVRYRCDACHDGLFTMELGATPVTMALIAEGKACGACHDGQRAFDDSFENCSRCHQPAAD